MTMQADASVEAAAGVLRASPGFVLPRSAFRRIVRNERDQLLNELVDLRVIVPGASRMEIQQLRDYVQWQRERRADDIKKALYRPAHQPKKLRQVDVVTGIKEYLEYRTAKLENRRRIYLGAGTEAVNG